MKRVKNKRIQFVDYRYDEGIRGRIESELSPTLTTKNSGISNIPLIMEQNDGHERERERVNVRLQLGDLLNSNQCDLWGELMKCIML